MIDTSNEYFLPEVLLSARTMQACAALVRGKTQQARATGFAQNQ